jgi:hypothetical protein
MLPDDASLLMRLIARALAAGNPLYFLSGSASI